MEVENVQNIPTVDVWRVTGPDPSRAEMAMRLYPHVLASAEACVLRGEASFTPDWREQTAAEAVKLADALRAALEKAR
jgi:hypothetical protein